MTKCFILVAAIATTSALAQMADSDGDGLPDVIEQQIIDADSTDPLMTFADVLPEHDFDIDGRRNLEEVQRGASPVLADYCYAVSEQQKQAWAENAARLKELLSSNRFDGSWARQWKWNRAHYDSFADPLASHPSAVRIHPLQVDTASMHRYVTVPSTGIPIFRFDLNNQVSDAYFAIFINAAKVFEGSHSGDWTTYNFDLRPWAGQNIQLEFVEGVGGPIGLFHFEFLWIKDAQVLSVEQPPQDILSPRTYEESAKCRWYERWVLRDEINSVLNSGVPQISGMADGKRFVLNTHPMSETIPAVIETVANLPATGAMLRYTARPSYDSLIKVYVRDTLISSNILDTTNGWVTIETSLAEFAGQTLPVKIEHWAGGANAWHFEGMHWAEIFVTSEPVLSIRVAQVEVCWQTSPNVSYRLQARDAVGSDWETVSDAIIGDGGKHCTRIEVPESASTRFFRLSPSP